MVKADIERKPRYGKQDMLLFVCQNFPLFLGGGGGSGTETTVTEATTDLLYQPRMMMNCEQSVEWLAGEIEGLGENLP
jgi:hypothetical protein